MDRHLPLQMQKMNMKDRTFGSEARTTLFLKPGAFVFYLLHGIRYHARRASLRQIGGDPW